MYTSRHHNYSGRKTIVLEATLSSWGYSDKRCLSTMGYVHHVAYPLTKLRFCSLDYSLASAPVAIRR